MVVILYGPRFNEFYNIIIILSFNGVKIIGKAVLKNGTVLIRLRVFFFANHKLSFHLDVVIIFNIYLFNKQ